MKVLGINENVEGRMVVIVEDIVDSGHTMPTMAAAPMKPKEVKIATLLFKPAALKEDSPRLWY